MNKKYKLMSWAAVAAAVIIFILVNVFMSVLSDKFPIKIDLTSGGRFELTDESREYLKTYDKDTTIYITASETGEDTNVRAVLDRYRAVNGKIKIKNVDIKKNPAFGREFVKNGESLSANSVIVTSGERFKVIENSEFYAVSGDGSVGLDIESKITSALKFVSSDTKLTAYFTINHGEADFAGAEEALINENYTVTELSTLTRDIPSDASLVIIACPTSDFTTAEIAKLDAYLSGGGSVQVYTNGGMTVLKNLNDYLKLNGISIGSAEIIESKSNAVSSGSSYMFVASYERNDVTDGIIDKKGITGYLPFSKSIETVYEPSGDIAVSRYLESMEGSYTSENLDMPTKDTAVSTEPAAIALLSENSRTGGKLYVSGTPMLLDYSLRDINSAGFANIEYFTAVSNSMAGAGEAFAVPVKSVGAEKLVMDAVRKNIFFAVIVVIVPLLILAAGAAVFVRRRNM